MLQDAILYRFEESWREGLGFMILLAVAAAESGCLNRVDAEKS